MFEQVDPSMARHEEMEEILAAYDRFLGIDESLVAPDALIREFIGGGIYEE